MSSNPLSRRGFDPRRLELIASGDSFRDEREPPLRLGDVVRLNSGGPSCLVVDILEGNMVAVSWRDSAAKVEEAQLPIGCVHRIEVTD